MADRDGRAPEDVRRDISREREELARAVEELRGGLDEVAKLRGKLPLVATAALAGGFVLAGGIGATMRLLARRGREGSERARVGRFAVVDRD